ncbi:uncharacterized protein [Diadema antillarum]|uniref:uncharacterized protein n=1 Tax=Diadema antillarum TaxID=105358 RepID=UPI003A89787F
MASPFHENCHCEGVGCLRKSSATYYVAEKQRLCDECATMKGHKIVDIQSKRVGWICTKHKKPVEFFCEVHDEAVCQSCSTVHHKPCSLKELDESLSQKRRLLGDLVSKTKDKKQEWKRHADLISRQHDVAEKHFETVKKEIQCVIRVAVSKHTERGKNERDAINKEFDEEIRRLNEKREKRLNESHSAEAKRREPIENARREFTKTLTNIQSGCNENFQECSRQTSEVVDVLDEALESVDSILLMSDQDLVASKTRALITALEATINSNTDSGFVEEISRVSQNVRFVKGAEGEEYRGQIEWPRGKWKQTDTIEIAGKIKHPCLIGYTSADDSVILKDGSRDAVIFVMSVNNKKTEEFRLQDSARIISCKSLNEAAVVCAKCCERFTGSDGLLSGSVALYDKQWKMTREFAVPSKTTTARTFVDIAVRQRSGVIVAVERSQSHIHAINPTNGKIVKSIACKDRIRMRALLPSGDIIAQRVPFDNTVLVIDRDGVSKEIAHSQTILNATVDSRTRDIYVACHEPERDRFVISRLSGQDWGDVTRVMTLPVATGLSKEKKYNHVVESNLILTPHGQMIVCDGRNVLVYKKTFNFQTSS